MKLGLYGINTGAFAVHPERARAAAVAAEAAGWESVWAAEHYVLPDPPTPDAPTSPDTPFLDPFLALAAVATATSHILLGTGVTVVPLHPPVMLAKKVASLDRLAGGRFLFGVGIGYLSAEFSAFEVTLQGRGHRTLEALATMRLLWRGDRLRGDGFAVRSEPPPMHPSGPPLHMGGHSRIALHRAAEHAHGWYGFGLEMDELERCVAELRAAGDATSRSPLLPDLEISITPSPRQRLERQDFRRLADLGVDRVVALPPPVVQRDEAALHRYLGALFDLSG